MMSPYFAVLVYLQQHTWRPPCRRRGNGSLTATGAEPVGSSGGFADYNLVMARTLGNALHQLQAFVQPHVKHVITQTFEQADEEFLGDKSDTAVHLLRQAIRIQRGDEVDQISALLPKRRLAMRE
jgi:hypothetical protein